MALKFPNDNASEATRPWARAIEAVIRDNNVRLDQIDRQSLPQRVLDLEKRVDALTTLVSELLNVNIVISPTRPDTTDLPVPTLWVGY